MNGGNTMPDFTQTLLPLSFPTDDKRPLPEIIADGKPDPDGWPAFPLAYKDVDGERYYFIQDWIAGVAQTERPAKVWDDFKRRFQIKDIQLSDSVGMSEPIRKFITGCRRLPYK